MSIADNPIAHDAEKAREWLEGMLWPEGPICPHSGLINCAYSLSGKAHRPGLYKCKGCEKQFTVTVGTLFKRSHISLNKWLLGLHLMVGSKKGVSAHQIHRMLGLTYKTAWFMCHRIREAMRDGTLGKLGGENKVVEVNEPYVGGKETNKHKSKRQKGMQGGKGKEPVLSLVERDGKVRSFHVPAVVGANLKPMLQAQIDQKSYLMTDEASVYLPIGETFGGHGTVNHSIEEYVRGNFWHTNTVENYLSIFKRGIIGTYHHVNQEHLEHHLAEFDFRYNERMAKVAKGIAGKRLTYRRTRGSSQAAQSRPAQATQVCRNASQEGAANASGAVRRLIGAASARCAWAAPWGAR
jgi:transposase-like protein